MCVLVIFIAQVILISTFKKKIAKTGFDGALFYKGTQTAKQLPVSEVKYKGTWDFMTDAKKDNHLAVLKDELVIAIVQCLPMSTHLY